MVSQRDGPFVSCKRSSLMEQQSEIWIKTRKSPLSIGFLLILRWGPLILPSLQHSWRPIRPSFRLSHLWELGFCSSIWITHSALTWRESYFTAQLQSRAISRQALQLARNHTNWVRGVSQWYPLGSEEGRVGRWRRCTLAARIVRSCRSELTGPC